MGKLQALSVDRFLRIRTKPSKDPRQAVISAMGRLARFAKPEFRASMDGKPVDPAMLGNDINHPNFWKHAAEFTVRFDSKRIADEVASLGELDSGVTLSVQQLTSQDEILTQFLVGLSDYANGGYHNFVPSENLLKVLGKVSIDVPSDYIKAGTKAYFELGGKLRDPTDNTPLDFALVRVQQYGLVNYLHIQAVDSDSAPRSYFFTLAPGVSIKTCTSNGPESYVNRGDIRYKEGSLDMSNDPFLRTCINLLLYISNPSEEFEEQLNELSTKKSKREGELANYTDKPFIRIGYGLDILRLVTSTDVGVSGHFRWQPYGPKRSLMKLIFIDPYSKKIKRVSISGEGES